MAKSDYIRDHKCVACGAVVNNTAAENDHIRSCPVNPQPGFLDASEVKVSVNTGNVNVISNDDNQGNDNQGDNG